MKKIGIETINDDNNYGNKLQNYAVQEVIKKIGAEPITIKNRYFSRKNNDNFMVKILKKVYHIPRKINFLIFQKKNLEIRKKCFQEFNKNINFTDYVIDENDNSAIKSNQFDYCIAGSDQVWNVNFNSHSKNSLLVFIEGEKRISFAASFGISELPEKYHDDFRNELNKFKAISVREEAGKNIVYNLTKREDVQVLVDPTMLLDSSDWDKVSKKPIQLNKDEKYILNYFLGKLSKSRKAEIDRIAKENNCKVINILDKNSKFYGTGPSEFLYLEKNAFLICTDSFHSCVFAILYNRPFIIFERDDKTVSMNSRIETLISKFNLKNRKFEGKITKENLEHDYTEAYKILKEERQKSKEFIEKALEIKNMKEGN